MKAPKPVSNESLADLKNLLSKEPRGDVAGDSLAFKLLFKRKELYEICTELQCWRNSYGSYQED